MSSKPLVSIIIPNFNAFSRLSSCLNSCFQQTYPNIEIIFVDNNSTDESVELVRQLATNTSHHLQLLHCYQQGANYARSKGFTYSKGDYIQWLDADDTLAPDKIALQVAALEKNRDYAIAYGDWEWCWYQNDLCLSGIAFKSQQYDDTLLMLLLDNWQPPHAYLLRREAASLLHELNAWNPQTRLSQDREYFTLAALIGLRFLHVKSACVYYNNWSHNQMTRSYSYLERIKNLSSMFRRFGQLAAQLPEGCLTEKHELVLGQNWNLWKLASVKIDNLGDDKFLVKNLEGNIAMQVNQIEALIASAMQKYQGAYTLEDHARLIVRVLWKYAVQRNGTDFFSAALELGFLLGLTKQAFNEPHFSLRSKIVERGNFDEKENHETILLLNPTCCEIVESSDRSSLSPEALLNRIPLYAPLFSYHRLAILYRLQKFCKWGWLKPASETSF